MDKELIEKRRYFERRYEAKIIRKLFGVPSNEMILNLKWDKEKNLIIVETLLAYDKKQGDI